MIDGLNRAALTGVEVGNAFCDHNAFPAMGTDGPWVEVAVMVASSLEAFNGMLQCATVIHPAIGIVGECSGV